MHRTLLLLGATTCGAVIAASIVLAPASAAQYPSGERLDEPHATRPIAAPNVSESPAIATSAMSAVRFFPGVTASGPAEHPTPVPASVDAEHFELASFLSSLAAPVASVPEPATAESSQPARFGDFLACVRNRESGGDYTVHELTGTSDAAGAYQFLPSTWNSIAEATGRVDLIGVDPAAAAPADQDTMAQALYTQQGSAPWGGSCG